MTNHLYLSPLRYGKVILLFLALFWLSFSLQAQTTWTGAADTNWANAANWTAGIPDVNDAVIIETTLPNAPLINAGTAAVANIVHVRIGGSLNVAANATLTIDANSLTPASTVSLLVDDSFVNEGIVEIPNSTLDGILTNVSANFINRGDILIGQNGGNIDRFGIYVAATSNFTNETGQIVIDNTGLDAIQNQATFTNEATLLIGQNAGNIGRYGIWGTDPTSTTNEATGVILINNTMSYAVLGQNSANIVNRGSLNIGSNVSGGFFINLSSTFTNAVCATISTLADIVGDSPFTNNGFLTLDNASITNTAFTNNGTVIYEQNTTPANATAGSISVTPIASCTGTFENALNSTIPNNFTVSNQWFLNANLTSPVGTYDAGTDVFTSNSSLSQGVSTLYFSISDNVNNCAETVSIEANFTENLATWTGAVSTDWFDEDNWIGCVPDANTTASIETNVPNPTVIPAGTAAVARSVYVASPGSLTVAATANLTIDLPAVNPGFANSFNVFGQVVNEGTIEIPNSNANGILVDVSGIFTNRGDILIGQNGGNIAEDGIFSGGQFIHESGQILIDNIEGNGIENRGTFDNVGELLIGQNDGNIGGAGILTTGTFDNCAGCGPIKIGNTTLEGIRQESGTFTNSADILIGQGGGSIGSAGIRVSAGSFTNELGLIIIDNTTVDGIINEAQFTNQADIFIGQNDGNIQNVGINTSPGSNFTNEAGQIVIDNTAGVAILNRNIFTNQAILSIGQNDGNIGNTGIFSLASSAFTNAAGQISIDNAGTTAIHSEGTFLNQSDIFIGQNGGNITFSGIVSQGAGTFTHEAGQIVIDNVGLYGVAQLSSGAFTNQANILIGQNDGNIARDGIWNAGSGLFSHETGQISIDNTLQNGILNVGPFVNKADIFIGQNDGNIIRSGIENTNSGTFIHETGQIVIDNTLGGILNAGSIGNGILNLGSFTSQSDILIGQNDGNILNVGINSTPGSSFRHEAGQISIDNTAGNAIRNRADFINQSMITIGQNSGNLGFPGIAAILNSNFTNTPTGTINIESTVLQAIEGENNATVLNQGIIRINDNAAINFVANASFTNDNCATVSTLGNITGNATVTNNGYLTIDGGAITNTAFTNNGVIVDVQGTAGTAYTNSSLSIASIATCNGVFDNALNITSPNNFTLGSQWYLNDDLTGLAGAYDVTTNVFTPAASLPNGLTTLYFSVSDDTNICAETVSISVDLSVDVTPPVIICPSSVSVNAPADACFEEVGFASPTATDTCDPNPTITLTSGTASGNSFDIGTVTNTYTATDASNNMSSCTMTITVVDNTNPTPICQDAIVVLDAAGNGSITTATIDNGSNDACGIASLSLNMTNFTCANVGDNMVTLTVTDNNGNTSTCTSIVDVQDNTSPTPTCQDITVQLDANGMANITANQIDNGSNDACGISSLSIDNENFSCNEVGNNTITLSVTDVNDNSDTCTGIVTIEDNIPPSVLTQNITVELDNEGNVTITVAQVDNGTNDACGLDDLVLNITEFNCANVGANTVQLTATDVNGNVASAPAIVTVVDVTPAEIQCRQPISTTNTPGLCERENLTILPPFVLYDNCGIESGITISRTPAINDFPIGTTTLTWTVTDSNGNPATCESLVIIEDTEAPTVGSCNTVIDFLEFGTCLAQVTVSVTAEDNCGVASVEGAGTFMLPFGIHPRTITITDVNGNVTLHEITIYVHDDQTPIVEFCPEDVEIDLNDLNSFDLPQPTFLDNCEIFSLTNDAPETFEVGITTVTFTAADTYGNWVNCIYDVNVIESLTFLDIIDEIEASTIDEESASMITWNNMQARTTCETCETTDYPEYIFLGDFNGHQYFLYNGSVNWTEATVLSEEIDGHLVTINDEKENEFLEHQLPNFAPDTGELFFWTGLNNENLDIEWQNGDAFEYLNFPYDLILQPDVVNAAVLNEDGTWTMTTGDNENSFIVERPCIDFTQTGPIVEEISEENDTTYTLLPPNTEWEIGEYEVTYAATDMCGNSATYSFEVIVNEANADYCSTGSTKHDIWMHEVTINDYFSGTGNNEGYANLTEEAIIVEANEPITVQLYPVGLDITPSDKPIYMRIWADLNNDGDFFDANELVFETQSSSSATAEFPYPTITEDTEMRIRVAVAEFQYPEVCADFTQGEAEDYLLFLPYVEEYPEDTRGSRSVNISPNPAGEYVVLDLKDYEGQDVEIRILDRLGKEQYRTKVDATVEEFQIDLVKFIDGMYFVEIKTDGRRTVTEKLVIDKLYGWRRAD